MTNRALSTDILKKRLPAAALVLLLHLVVFALLILHRKSVPPTPEREAIIFLSQPKPKAAATAPKAAKPEPEKPLPLFVPPTDLPQKAPDMSGLSFMLSACGISNWGKLSPEDRTLCSKLARIEMTVGVNPDDFRDVSKAKNADLYAAEVATKNAPLRIPCTHLSSIPGPVPNSAATTTMGDPLCAAKRLGDYFDRLRRGDY